MKPFHSEALLGASAEAARESQPFLDAVTAASYARARRLTAPYRLRLLLDKMLGAQSRFAVAWMDGERLTRQMKRDEQIRDDCREQILALLAEVMVELEDGW